jgi:hypothetical protein
MSHAPEKESPGCLALRLEAPLPPGEGLGRGCGSREIASEAVPISKWFPIPLRLYPHPSLRATFIRHIHVPHPSGGIRRANRQSCRFVSRGEKDSNAIAPALDHAH